jgi:hypothetical protein
LVRKKYVCFEKKEKKLFDGKQKMTKKKKLNLKIPQNGQMSGFGIFKFSNSNFFLVIVGFPSKKFLFLKASILLSYQKKNWGLILSIEKKICYKR